MKMNEAISQIAFFRPSAVGDFVFALPCLASLKRQYPAARLVYIGRRWHVNFLANRPGSVDEVMVLPDVAGINASTSDGPAVEAFIADLQQRQFDLALQAFGGGKFSNPLVRRFGARHCIGFQAHGAPPLDKSLPFGELHNRRLQLLELATLAGVQTPLLEAGLAITPADLNEAARLLPHSGPSLVILQPGASDPRRRWSAENFARVGDALATSGMTIAVNGTPDECHIVSCVISAMKHQAIDLTGKLSLGGLCGLLAQCRLLVSNDTGPLHLATALGVPAVGIYWLSNLLESQPLQQRLHRAAWATATACPECGMDNLRQRCPHQRSFVDQISVDEVLALAYELMQPAS